MADIIESESATTDHARNRFSGGAVWIIVGGIAGIVAVGLLLAALLSLGASRLLEAMSYPYFGTDPYYYYDDPLEGLLGDGLSGSGTSEAPAVDEGATLTYADGLELYFSSYEDSLASLIGANDYAGAQLPVSNYVAALVTLDSVTSGTLTIHLRTARARAEDPEAAAAEVSQAIAGCEEAVASLAEMAGDVPDDVTGPSSADVVAGLSEATTLLGERWQALKDALALFNDEGATMGSFNSELSQSQEDAERAAELLQEALSLSRTR